MQSRPYHTDKNGINFKHKLERDHARPFLRSDTKGNCFREQNVNYAGHQAFCLKREIPQIKESLYY